MVYLIKKRGHREEFDENKIFESCYAACMSCGFGNDDAAKLSSRVVSSVKSWVVKESRRKGRESIATDEIFGKVLMELKEMEKHDVALMYGSHRDIS